VKVHNHTILTKLKIPSPAWDAQFAWVRGYILALEDILGDLEQMSQDAAKVPYDTYTIMTTRIRVGDTLASAQSTLATLEQMEADSTKEEGS